MRVKSSSTSLRIENIHKNGVNLGIRYKVANVTRMAKVTGSVMPIENIEVDVKPIQSNQHVNSSLSRIDRRFMSKVCINL